MELLDQPPILLSAPHPCAPVPFMALCHNEPRMHHPNACGYKREGPMTMVQSAPNTHGAFSCSACYFFGASSPNIWKPMPVFLGEYLLDTDVSRSPLALRYSSFTMYDLRMEFNSLMRKISTAA